MDDGIPEDSFTWFFCIKYGMIMYKVCMNPTQSTSCFETETSQNKRTASSKRAEQQAVKIMYGQVSCKYKIAQNIYQQ